MTVTAVSVPTSAKVQEVGDVLIEVDGLRIRNTLTGKDAVRGVSFTLRAGQIVGIVGESGSGKTLTCRSLLGILPGIFEVAGGSAQVAGRDALALSPREWRELRGTTITAVFQDPASYLNPSIKVGKQIAEVLRVKRGMGRREAREHAIELLRDVRLRDAERVARQYPHELSGGMLQRVLIAAAISLEPDVLIADEVTTALDVTVQAEILDLLVDLKNNRNLSLVVVSHDLAVVGQLCDEVLVMRDGQVVEQGQASEILFEPQHEYTRLLVDEHHQFGLDKFLAEPEDGSASHVA